MPLLKGICFSSNFVAFIAMRRKCQMRSNFSGVDFLGTALNLESKERKFRLPLFSAKKCTKKRDARANFLFCLTNLLLF